MGRVAEARRRPRDAHSCAVSSWCASVGCARQGLSEVVGLWREVEADDDIRLGVPLGAQLLGERHVVPGVAHSRRVELAMSGERSPGIGVDGLELGEPRLAVRSLAGDHEVGVDEVGEHIEDIGVCRLVAIDDRLDRVEIGPACEDAELAEDGVLMRPQQCARPVDGLAKRVLARGDVSAGGRDIERVVEPREQGLGAEDFDPRRRQLEREGQPIEAPADSGDLVGVLVGQPQARPDPLRVLDEEPNGSGSLGGLDPRVGRQLQRRDRMLVLRCNVQRMA